MVFHYSTLLHLAYILDSGVLVPSRREAHGNHRFGLLWFSRNGVMERTALKSDAPMVRFGSEDPRITPWKPMARKAGYTSGVIRRLEKSGRKAGATPSDWLAVNESLPIEDMSIEVQIGGKWLNVNRSQLTTVRGANGTLELAGAEGTVAVVGRTMSQEGVYLYGTAADLMQPENLLDGAKRRIADAA